MGKSMSKESTYDAMGFKEAARSVLSLLLIFFTMMLVLLVASFQMGQQNEPCWLLFSITGVIFTLGFMVYLEKR
jgi:Mn2+/Fe2+ NRAMP family transporter